MLGNDQARFLEGDATATPHPYSAAALRVRYWRFRVAAAPIAVGFPPRVLWCAGFGAGGLVNLGSVHLTFVDFYFCRFMQGVWVVKMPAAWCAPADFGVRGRLVGIR